MFQTKVLENLYGKEEEEEDKEIPTKGGGDPPTDGTAVSSGDQNLPPDVASRIFSAAPPPVGFELSESPQDNLAPPEGSPTKGKSDSESSSGDSQPGNFHTFLHFGMY